MRPTLDRITGDLREQGVAPVPRLTPQAYEELARTLGEIVGRERIALRPGAHAYVAKPGRVPFHTDHPDVDILAWWCEAQDSEDGASQLVDTRPVVAALPEDVREILCDVELVCPPLAGGPPTERRQVLRPVDRGYSVFCSPWLKSAWPLPTHEAALELFRQRLSEHSRTAALSIRLEPGTALFVDNHRILHGRGPIPEGSLRCLRRLWIRLPGDAAR
jgi:alpha-ketoglutarate-dependent taurine dioxygenase